MVSLALEPVPVSAACQARSAGSAQERNRTAHDAARFEVHEEHPLPPAQCQCAVNDRSVSEVRAEAARRARARCDARSGPRLTRPPSQIVMAYTLFLRAKSAKSARRSSSSNGSCSLIERCRRRMRVKITTRPSCSRASLTRPETRSVRVDEFGIAAWLSGGDGQTAPTAHGATSNPVARPASDPS